MKKLFLIGAAAIAMLASCQKTEVNTTSSTPIDDSKPVAMQFGVNAPSFEVTKTKAAVDQWNSTQIQVIGLINEGTAAAPAYDFTKKVFDQSAVVVDQETKIALYQKNGENEQYAGENVPYFYAEGKLYDFYAYHLGKATAEPQDETVENTITRKVTISGSEDLMVAKPNKSTDIKADTSNDGVTTADVYSAWAARRGVQPTLVFEHALTRFNFIVRGMDEPAKTVTIDQIAMTGLAKTGTLTVVGTELGFKAGEVVAATDNAPDANTLVLKNSDDTKYEPEPVVLKNSIPAGQGSCLMVQPDLEKVHVVVDMHHTYQGANNKVDIELEPYEFDVDASQVLKEGVAAGLTKFAAGTAYNIYINVYGPQEIIIKAELTEWADGGDYTYDPDKNRPGGEATSVTAERTVEDNVIKYTVTYSSDITAIQGAIAKEQPAADSEAWQTLVDTRAETGISFKVPENENAEDYKLFVRYTTADETDWVTPEEPVKPAFAILKSYVVMPNEESYNQLPATYRAENTWDKYLTDYQAWLTTFDEKFHPLPWLAVEVTPDSDIASFTVENGDFAKEIYTDVHTTTGLITVSAKEIGIPYLTNGTWTVTVNGIRKKIVVEHNIKRAYFIEENEESYNQIPEAYRAMNGCSWEAYKQVADCVDGVKDCGTDHNHETINNHVDFDRLPWLAVDVVPGSAYSVVVVNPSNEQVYEKSGTAGSIGFMPLSAKEMNTDLVPGIWTVIVNDIPAYIEVK